MTEQVDPAQQDGKELAPIAPKESTLDRLASDALGEVLAEALGRGQDSLQAISVTRSESYSGPFAHPDVLSKLDKVVANGAERAFSLTEKEQAHRHQMDLDVLKADIKDKDRVAFDRRLTIILSFTL